MTVSAPVRLMPSPPLRVERMKQNSFGSELKRSMSRCLRSIPVTDREGEGGEMSYEE
jgi:hypothetical protein